MASEQGEGYYHLLQGQSCCSRMQLLRGNAPYSDGPYGPFVQLHCNRVAVLLGEAVLVGSDLAFHADKEVPEFEELQEEILSFVMDEVDETPHLTSCWNASQTECSSLDPYQHPVRYRDRCRE